MNTSRIYEGLLNQKKNFLGNLDPAQQAQMTALRLFFKNMTQLPLSIRNEGSAAWTTWVLELENKKMVMDDMCEYNPKPVLQETLEKIQSALDSLVEICKQTSSIGTLYLVQQWFEKESTRKVVGTEVCKSIAFAYK